MGDSKVLLYAEDDIGYADLMKRILTQAGYDKYQLAHVSDGQQAIDYLKGEGIYADRSNYPLPSLALVDLKMPRVTGFEVLRWIRQESAFPNLPVVVLTSSDELRDIQVAYRMGANSFLMKPVNVHDLKNMLKALDGYWMKLNVTEKRSTL